MEHSATEKNANERKKQPQANILSDSPSALESWKDLRFKKRF